MIVYEYTTTEESVKFHTVNFDTIPQGATIQRSLPIEEFYSEENLIDQYFQVFHQDVGLTINDIKNKSLEALRSRKRFIFDIPVKERTSAESDELCDINSQITSLSQKVEKTYVHIGRDLYISQEEYNEMLDQCRCIIIIGGTNALTFNDLKKAISNYHDLVCTTPNTPIEFCLTGQEIGRYRLFQYTPREINISAKAA